MLGLILPWWAKYAAIALAVAALWGHGWVKGNAHGTAKLTEYIGQQAVAAAAVVVKQNEVTERVVTKYVKVAGETRTVTDTVEREVIRYVETHPVLRLDPEWGRLHDAAARNALSPPGRQPDGPLRTPADPAGRVTDGGPGAADSHLELRAASSLR